MLKAKNLTKTFCLKSGKTKSETVPLRGADLSLESGEKAGITGVSGEGKTTLARIICGFVRPDEGNVFLDGEPLYGKKMKYDRRTGVKIQLISQQPFQSLDPAQKIGNAVSEALLVSKNAENAREAKIKTAELFERVGLDPKFASRLPSQLSGGQAARVAVARALAVKPKVIVADEATAMLDISSQAQIVRLFEDIAAEEKVSILFISHDETLVKAFADRRYRLEEGKLYPYSLEI